MSRVTFTWEIGVSGIKTIVGQQGLLGTHVRGEIVRKPRIICLPLLKP